MAPKKSTNPHHFDGKFQILLQWLQLRHTLPIFGLQCYVMSAIAIQGACHVRDLLGHLWRFHLKNHYFLDVLSGLYLIETPPRKTCNLTEDFPETLPQDLSWKISRMSAFRARKRLLFHWREKSRRKREFLSKVYDIDLSVVAITSLQKRDGE